MKGIWHSLPMLNLLWILPLLVALFIFDAQRRRTLIARLSVLPDIQIKLLQSVNKTARHWKKILILLAVALIIIALARPSWNPTRREINRKGRDVVFVLDVSKSMLADDLKPSRLERAKIAIQDCLDIMEGDRAALVAFAGNAVVKCPLTLDYGFFRMMLDDVDINSVSRGGTMIGDALRTVLNDAFDDQDRQFKDVILITDGEDQGSFPVEAAKKLGERGVRLIAVGLGDEATGTSILTPNENGQYKILKYKGEVVRSRLDSDTLRKMVAETPGGRYLPVSTGNFDLGNVYLNLIASEEKRDLEAQSVELYEEKYQIFLAFALIFLVLESLLGDRKRVSRASALLLLVSLPVWSQGAYELNELGNQRMKQEDYAGALEAYGEAREKSSKPAKIHYNEGLAHYRLRNLEAARNAFHQACESGRTEGSGFEALCKLALGNSWFAEALRQESGQDLQKAIEACTKSIQFYREANERNPKLETARNNLDKARLKLKKLLQKAKEEQQKQQQQQNQEDKQEKKEGEQQKQEQQQQNQGEEEQQQQEGEQEKQEEQKQEEQKQEEQQQEGEQEEQEQQAPQPSEEGSEEKQEKELEREIRGILDREKENQRHRQLRRQQGGAPVERDW